MLTPIQILDQFDAALGEGATSHAEILSPESGKAHASAHEKGVTNE